MDNLEDDLGINGEVTWIEQVALPELFKAIDKMLSDEAKMDEFRRDS